MTTKIARRLGVNAGNQHQCNPNNYAHSISVSQTKHLERSISGQTAYAAARRAARASSDPASYTDCASKSRTGKTKPKSAASTFNCSGSARDSGS